MTYQLVAAGRSGEYPILRGTEQRSGRAVLAVASNGESSRLRRSWELRDELDREATLRPIAFESIDRRPHLILLDPGGVLLAELATPLEIGLGLRAALALTAAVSTFHASGFIHRDIKPAVVVYDDKQRRAWLGGTGLSLRVARSGLRNAPLETMVGTPAYMAPEQTGRVNWPVDARSDLYSLGVALYQLFTGVLPFDDEDPLSLLHAHIAREPRSPRVSRSEIPEVVSAIILRLLAKNPSERYQTASGLARDLWRSWENWSAAGSVDTFALGLQDVSDRLGTPSQVFGREADLAAIDRLLTTAVSRNSPALLLVEGASGVGKSAIVEEARRRAAGDPSCLFATGKLEELGRATPLAALGRAVAELLPRLHADDGLASEVRTAVAPHGRLLIGLLPELEDFFDGEPEPIALSVGESHQRFQRVLGSFVRVFSRSGRSLVLVLDDVQWIDVATLGMVRALLSDVSQGPLTVIATYRGGEIAPTTLSELKAGSGNVHELVLQPLGQAEVKHLICSMVGGEAEWTDSLARFVFEKTGGNPFFAIQFLHSLAEENLLRLDSADLRWHCNLAAVQARGFTDNLVDIMLAKLVRLPPTAREALVHLAFLGNAAAPRMLATALGVEPTTVHARMLPAVQAGLVALTTSTYMFLHDRIRESVYELVQDAGERAMVHRRIGEHLVEANLPGTLFDVFFQLDRGAAVASEDTRVRDATLSLAAAKEARASAAYVAAKACLVAASGRLPADAWSSHYRLVFEIELLKAECELFLGDLAAASSRLVEVLERTTDLPDRATVTRQLMSAHLTMGRIDLAAKACHDYLDAVGIHWPAQPTDDQVAAELALTKRNIDERPTEAIVNLPLVQDESMRRTFDEVLVDSMAPMLYSGRNPFLLCVFGTLNLAFEHGISPAIAWLFAVAAAWARGIPNEDQKTVRRLAAIAEALARRFAGHNLSARTHISLAHHVLPWLGDCREADGMADEAQAAMHRGGELLYLVYTHMHSVTHRLANGLPLPVVISEAATGRALAAAAKVNYAVNDIDHQLALVNMLRGSTPRFGSLDDGSFTELDFESTLRQRPVPLNLEVRYWIRKLVARFLAGDYTEAVAAADRVWPTLWIKGGNFGPHFRENADFHFFGALALAALPDALSRRDELLEHRNILSQFAVMAPTTYGSRAALVEAELLRVDGEDPGRLYERAIDLARETGFVHHEAFILEVVARYWATLQFRSFTRLYREQARDAYRRWGADAKAQHMEAQFPELRNQGAGISVTTTMAQPVDQLDLATAVAVSEAVSSNLDPERLVQGLLSMALKTAGAERVILIAKSRTGMTAEAQATTEGETLDVDLGTHGKLLATFCEQIVQYVASTRTPVVLDDAMSDGLFATDCYISEHRCRSLACVPLTRRGKLSGVLYFENNLTTHAFAARRLTAIKLIASQAAAALENARLYADLAKARAAEQALQTTREALAHLARVATLGELTASIAHEVTQPLTSVSVNAASCSRWLEAGKLTEGAAAATRVVREAERAMEVVRRLRSLFQKRGSEATELDLNDAVSEVVALTRAEMTRNGIATEVRLTPASPRVCANRVQVQQVVMNLVLNAIQAFQGVVEGPKRILVATELLDERVRTLVRDSGVGVSKENVATLFEPFFSTKPEGTGVGLSISRSIVESYRGTLWHAPNDGVGATFGFDLPLLDAPG